jgi:hypothetical protein
MPRSPRGWKIQYLLVRLGAEPQRVHDLAFTELRLILTNADLDADDDTLIAPVAMASSAASAKREEQAAEAGKLAQKAAAIAAEDDTLRQQHRQRSGELRERQESIRTRRASCEAAAGALPGGYRVDMPITAEAFTAAAKRIEHRRAELAEFKDQLDAAQRSIDQIGRQLETLSQKIRDQVDEPAHEIIVKLTAAEQRLIDLASLVQIPQAPARPGGSLDDDAAWAGKVKTATRSGLAGYQLGAWRPIRLRSPPSFAAKPVQCT